MRMRRPEWWEIVEWTPGEIKGGVQNYGELQDGRQVRLDAASRIVESCGMDATGMLRWRPEWLGVGNRTPEEC